ncbi:unnamed protein product [Rotaria sp. Silwood1]|nr:unnamed protein product [Rotaria sp. Silwood1]CAF3507549.1 unnamed protein product [Rotaria sp. Silwood1]CAF5011582.1 unnamed protein product [Rotaria sp. Silwood1]
MSIYIYEIHHSLQQTNTSVIISNNQAQSDTISCLSTLIFDCLAQALTGIQIFSLNIRQQLIVSSSSTVTKSSNISSQVSLNNSIIYIHTISIRQPKIYLFDSGRASNILPILQYFYLTKRLVLKIMLIK